MFTMGQTENDGNQIFQLPSVFDPSLSLSVDSVDIN